MAVWKGKYVGFASKDGNSLAKVPDYRETSFWLVSLEMTHKRRKIRPVRPLLGNFVVGGRIL
jgi:hypothetical protein